MPKSVPGRAITIVVAGVILCLMAWQVSAFLVWGPALRDQVVNTAAMSIEECRLWTRYDLLAIYGPGGLHIECALIGSVRAIRSARKSGADVALSAAMTVLGIVGTVLSLWMWVSRVLWLA